MQAVPLATIRCGFAVSSLGLRLVSLKTGLATSHCHVVQPLDAGRMARFALASPKLQLQTESELRRPLLVEVQVQAWSVLNTVIHRGQSEDGSVVHETHAYGMAV
jgi:hypothetical protein